MELHTTQNINTEIGEVTIISYYSFEIFILMESLLQRNVNSKEFTFSILHQVIESPSLSSVELSNLSESVLLQLASAWAKSALKFSNEINSFEDFKAAVNKESQKCNEELKDAFSALVITARDFSKQMNHAVENFANIHKSIVDGFKQSWLFDSLPDYSVLSDSLKNIKEEVRVGEEALEEADLSFYIGFLPVRAIREIGDLAVSERTNKIFLSFATYTKSENFVNGLLTMITESKILSSRIKIFERLMKAHREQDYIVSIPLALMQIEGLLSEALVLKKFASRNGNKFYELDSNLQIRKNRKSKPLEYRGIKSKAEKLDDNSKEAISVASQYLAIKLSPKRNNILHGNESNYSDEADSTRLNLILAVFIMEIAKYEGIKIPKF